MVVFPDPPNVRNSRAREAYAALRARYKVRPAPLTLEQQQFLP